MENSGNSCCRGRGFTFVRIKAIAVELLMGQVATSIGILLFLVGLGWVAYQIVYQLILANAFLVTKGYLPLLSPKPIENNFHDGIAWLFIEGIVIMMLGLTAALCTACIRQDMNDYNQTRDLRILLTGSTALFFWFVGSVSIFFALNYGLFHLNLYLRDVGVWRHLSTTRDDRIADAFVYTIIQDTGLILLVIIGRAFLWCIQADVERVKSVNARFDIYENSGNAKQAE